MSRATNCTTPGYFAVVIIARNSCDSKFFPVCGHLCGQTRFFSRLRSHQKSRKCLCRKGFTAFSVPIVDTQRIAPKPPALPTALHPVIQFLSSWAYSPNNHTAPRMKYGSGYLLTHIILLIYAAKSSTFPDTYHVPASKRQTLTPASAMANTNQNMHMTRG